MGPGIKSGVARNFEGGGHNFHIFFRQNNFKADRETRKALGRSGGMLPRRNFENLHAVMQWFLNLSEVLNPTSFVQVPVCTEPLVITTSV